MPRPSVTGRRVSRWGTVVRPTKRQRFWEIVRARLNVVEVVQFDLGIVLAAVAGPGLIGLGGYTVEG